MFYFFLLVRQQIKTDDSPYTGFQKSPKPQQQQKFASSFSTNII